MKRIFASVLLTSLLCACMPASDVQESETISVAASIYPLAFLAEHVGGERVTVTIVTPAGVEPHDFEPSPVSIAAVHDADLFLWNGEGLDPWAEKVVGEMPAAKTIRFTAYPDLIPVTSADGSGAMISGENDAPGDPHVWLNPLIMVSGADLIAKALSEIDPAHADEYAANAEAFMAELQKLDQEFSEGLKTCELSRIVVSHDAFRYLARRYGFTTVAIAGVSPESEPTPRALAEITDLVKKEHVKVIFTETLGSPRLSETISRETGAATRVLNPLEGLTEEQVEKGETYLTVMRENLDALRMGLRCTP